MVALNGSVLQRTDRRELIDEKASIATSSAITTRRPTKTTHLFTDFRVHSPDWEWWWDDKRAAHCRCERDGGLQRYPDVVETSQVLLERKVFRRVSLGKPLVHRPPVCRVSVNTSRRARKKWGHAENSL